jgi:hypothetical protein
MSTSRRVARFVEELDTIVTRFLSIVRHAWYECFILRDVMLALRPTLVIPQEVSRSHTPEGLYIGAPWLQVLIRHPFHLGVGK